MKKLHIISILLIVLTSCSSQLNNKMAISSKIAVGNVIAKTSDKGIIIAGLTQKSNYHSRGNINHGSSIICKINKDGKKVWEKEYDFLKQSIVFDIIETTKSNLLIISSARNNYPHYSFKKNTYLTTLDKDGKILSQKTFKGSIKRVIEDRDKNLFLIGFQKSRYDTIIKKQVYQPFLTYTDSRGNIKWTKEIDIEINSINKIELTNNILYINSALYRQGNIKDVLIGYNLTTSHIKINEISEVVISFINKSTHDNNWVLQIKNNKTNTITEVDLKQYTHQSILPQLKLQNFHVCHQLNEATPSNNLILESNNNKYITTIITTDKINKTSQESVSTQAYCNNESKGILILKINNNKNLLWAKFIEENAIPLDIIKANNKIIITGSMLDKKTMSEKLFLSSVESD